jgi:hypothetical protein
MVIERVRTRIVSRELDFVAGNQLSAGSLVTGTHADRGTKRTYSTPFTLWAFAALGMGITLLNLKWPVCRNGLDYAKAALDILAHRYDLYAVVRDEAWTGGKPILFSLVAAPIAWAWNANTGVVLASALSTIFFLWTVTLALPRLNALGRVDDTLAPLELIWVALNPLLIYQFWSAYPDSLFAGLVILAFVLTDTIAREPKRDTRWHIVALGVIFFAAIHTKLYGGVLGIACPAYLLIQGKRLLTDSVFLRSKLILATVVFALLAALVVAAKKGSYPLLALTPNAGFNDYLFGLGGSGLTAIVAAARMIAVAALLAFQAALLFLLSGRARKAFAAGPSVFCAVYLLGLIPASGMAYNMRYLLPAFVFLVPALAAGADSLGPTRRRVILGLYAIVAVVSTLNFNVAGVAGSLWPLTSRIFGAQLQPGGLLENLRLSTQIALKKQIDTINAKVPSTNTLYWSSDYYGTATHGLAHALGVKADLNVQYVLEPSDPPESVTSVFLTEFTSFEPTERLSRAPHWATSIPLGNGLFRLDPISVDLVAMPSDHVEPGTPIQLRANIHAGSE